MLDQSNLASDVRIVHRYRRIRSFPMFQGLILLATFLLIGAAQAQPMPDTVSDRVGATPGQFRVDESGSATYSVPIYAAPGTAGVVPQMALAYTSQGGYGPIGKGWSISGASAISRCRASREHGDFINAGVSVDGNPGPVNFTASDRYCLDGQRLIPAPSGSPACKVLSGATTTNLRTEIESFSRICAYTFDVTFGPRFFTVERKDGSTSWYGDRVSTAGSTTGSRPDGYVEANNVGQAGKYISWSQTRFQDSTGNFIDYLYSKDPSGAYYLGEQLLKEVQYTGKVVLAGQAGSLRAPYAKIIFNYSARSVDDYILGYVSGSHAWQTQKLVSITVTNGASTVRHYALTYAKSLSGTGVDTLIQLQECSDSSSAICLASTNFDWSVARNEFSTQDTLESLNFGSYDKFEGYKLADVDGDGLQDMVRLKDGGNGDQCPTEYVIVSFGQIDAYGRPVFVEPWQTMVCTSTELMSGLGNNSWMLFDYDGDGKADLFMAGDSAHAWMLYPSLGRPAAGGKIFNNTSNLLAGLSPAIPGGIGPQLADLNGDGLADVVYPRAGSIYARIMTINDGVATFDVERLIVLDSPITSRCNGIISCTVHAVPANNNDTGAFQLNDFNGDARSDLLITTTAVTVSGSNVYSKIYLDIMLVDVITDTTITLKSYHSIQTADKTNNGTS